MNLLLLSRIDEELDSSEVASLCFLCRDVLNRKRLEAVKDGRGLFLKLQEKGLLENHHFLSHLLDTIGRVDLLNLLESDSSQPELPQSDASPALSEYRRMLFQVCDNITQENLTKMKFLLSAKLARGRLELCTTPLDVLAEMERQGLLSEEKLEDLQRTLEECDSQLAGEIQQYRARTGGSVSQQEASFVHPIRNLDLQPSSSPQVSIDQRMDSMPQSLQNLSVSDTQLSRVPSQTLEEGRSVYSDSEMDSCPHDQRDNYVLTHNPRGVCFIINNRHFLKDSLPARPGTEQDEQALLKVFSRLGFKVEVQKDLTETAILEAVRDLGGRSHAQADALVVCVLSHGDKGCVLGTDGGRVLLSSLTEPFTSGHCPSLAGKPKLFFIQACQGSGFQRGTILHASTGQGERIEEGRIEADADESVPFAADFLIGMATVEECKSFRNTREGSIYIQALCKQLEWGGARGENILTVLTRVNSEVSRGVYKGNKQMPEPKYTLTKDLILSFL